MMDLSRVNSVRKYVGGGRIAIYTEPVLENTVNKDGEFTIEEVFELMPRCVSVTSVITALM